MKESAAEVYVHDPWPWEREINTTAEFGGNSGQVILPLTLKIKQVTWREYVVLIQGWSFGRNYWIDFIYFDFSSWRICMQIKEEFKGIKFFSWRV